MTWLTLRGAARRLEEAERYPYGRVLWSDWVWVELPPPSSQMWPASKARRA